MGFYAKSFVYDDLPSEQFNLEIANIDGGNSTNMGSGNVEIIEQYIYRRQKPYFYGVSYSSKLTFPISFFSPDEITALDASYAQDWLFGQLEYKRLSLIQADMDGIYFNVIFTNPQIMKIGNVIYGFSGQAVCDSQFAWTYPTTVTYNYTDPIVSGSFIFYNNSHYKSYLYPELTFTMNSTGGSCILTNTSDNDRVFSFTGLSPYEVIVVNNDLNIITSSMVKKDCRILINIFLDLYPE